MLLRFLWSQRYSLLVIGLTGWLLWQTGRLAIGWMRSDTQRERPLVTGSDWPMFRGNPHRTGNADQTEEISITTRRWSGGWADQFLSSPAISGNRAYCVSGRDGTVYCWDLHSGDLQWATRPPGWRETFSSPVVAEGRLYYGEGFHRTRKSRVVCFELLPSGKPRLAWTFETNGHVECTPLVTKDGLFVAAGDDGLYKLSLSETSGNGPKVIWHIPGEILPDVETGLLVDDDRVYVGLGQPTPAVVELNPENGEIRHRNSFLFSAHAPPAIDGNNLVVGMGDGDYVNYALPGQGGGQVACIDMATHEVEWTYPTQGTVLGAVVISDSEIIFGCADGHVRILNSNGVLIHDWDSGDPILASLAVTKNQICGVTVSGRLFLLNRKTFELEGEQRLGVREQCLSSPSISGGVVVVGSEHNGVQCFGASLSAAGSIR